MCQRQIPARSGRRRERTRTNRLRTRAAGDPEWECRRTRAAASGFEFVTDTARASECPSCIASRNDATSKTDHVSACVLVTKSTSSRAPMRAVEEHDARTSLEFPKRCLLDSEHRPALQGSNPMTLRRYRRKARLVAWNLMPAQTLVRSRWQGSHSRATRHDRPPQPRSVAAVCSGFLVCEKWPILRKGFFFVIVRRGQRMRQARGCAAAPRSHVSRAGSSTRGIHASRARAPGAGKV